MAQQLEKTKWMLAIALTAAISAGCAARYSAEGSLGSEEGASLGTGGGGSGSGNSGADLTAAPMAPDAVQKACSDFTMQRTTQRIPFPRETVNCPWNTDENMDLHDQHYQARIEQVRSVQLPAGALICGMRLLTRTSDFFYDDEFVLDFKGLVLASSADFTNTFISEGNYVRYDWGRIKARAWASTPLVPYCAGSDRGLSTCSIPDTSTNGPLILSYDDQVIREMSSLTSQDTNHQFRMPVTGDNDPTVDCRHNGVDFDVEISYVQ